MLLLVLLGYVAAAATFYALINRMAPLREEPVWVHTAPPRSSQVVEMFAQTDRRAAA